jgi:hypothetical protein
VCDWSVLQAREDGQTRSRCRAPRCHRAWVMQACAAGCPGRWAPRRGVGACRRAPPGWTCCGPPAALTQVRPPVRCAAAVQEVAPFAADLPVAHCASASAKHDSRGAGRLGVHAPRACLNADLARNKGNACEHQLPTMPCMPCTRRNLKCSLRTDQGSPLSHPSCALRMFPCLPLTSTSPTLCRPSSPAARPSRRPPPPPPPPPPQGLTQRRGCGGPCGVRPVAFDVRNTLLQRMLPAPSLCMCPASVKQRDAQCGGMPAFACESESLTSVAPCSRQAVCEQHEQARMRDATLGGGGGGQCAGACCADAALARGCGARRSLGGGVPAKQV